MQRPVKLFVILWGLASLVSANPNVYVSRFWHNHQPIYWPEWNGNGSQTQRVQFAWDSIVLKPGQTYNSGAAHPENDLVQIFGLDDRRNAYQSGPRNSLATLPQSAGFAVSYSGSLMDNVRSLGSNGQLGYGGGWWDGWRESSTWTTPSGSRRMDLVGFTYHHSLSPLLPKAVFRKELQIFKQAWWKAWNKNPDLSDHSKGFFPTEMAFSRHMVDVLVDEGYEWSIVASHHLSRTCPTYLQKANPEGSYNIFSSPPNRADLLGPSPTQGWWYGEPNPGNAAWNVAPFAYQLQRAQYVNPETGAVKTLVLVPSDDVLSYRFGYANEGIGKIQAFIAPFATDPARPVMVMPATDGDNAWGGGSSSWFEATPQFFNDAAGAGYRPSAVQDFVNAHQAAAPVTHIEDGAWIFPESDYGSPYFLKWIEPPVRAPGSVNIYPGTLIDLETPGFALKFWSWAPVITGANWVETAEQVLRDEGGTVEAWKIQAPYDWNGTPANPNPVERAWHIYLAGLDSGFNYYGGLGNDDEVKAALATRRAQELLQPWFTTERRANDRTPPSVLKPQRFPHNPGGYTFGWFNSIPGGDTRYLKRMPSDFYIWTHVYDLSGVQNIRLRLRVDADGVNAMNTPHNETYAGGADVGAWIDIPMTRRSLPNTQAALNAAANNGQINYFSDALPLELAEYAFARIDDASLPDFRGKLLDYYIEATDTRGNVHKSDIQHVFVEDDGAGSLPRPSLASWTPAAPTNCPDSSVRVSYSPNDGPLAGAASIHIVHTTNGWDTFSTVALNPDALIALPPGATLLEFYFTDGGSLSDTRNGQNWSVPILGCPQPSSASLDPPDASGCGPRTLRYTPGTAALQGQSPVVAHLGFNDWASVQSLEMTFADGVWSVPLEITPGVSAVNAVFRNADASVWDNNGGEDWTWTVAGCPGPYLPMMSVVPHSPVISSDPADADAPGDLFDLSSDGGAAPTYTQGGFGDFGAVVVNVDADALYLGGTGLDVGGDNNAAVIFLSVDTLGTGLSNLWNLGGAPAALDQLHNVEFEVPAHIAILLGDRYGDGNYPSFLMAGGYDHGQGVYRFGTTDFQPLSTARLSQFGDAGSRATRHWELRIPWAALNAGGPEDLGRLHLSGLLLSSATQGNDRYLSGNILGASAQASHALDTYNNYGTAFLRLRPVELSLPHLDGDSDGMDNEFERVFFGAPGAGEAEEDNDDDGLKNGDEYRAGTDPLDPGSALVLQELRLEGASRDIRWQSVGGKAYVVEYNDHPGLDPSAWQTLGSYSETLAAPGQAGQGLVNDPTENVPLRFYRIRLLP